MRNILSIFELPRINDLFSNKERELLESVGNLQLKDVKEDIDYNNTIRRIKKNILLSKVIIQAPEIKEHHIEQVSFNGTYGNPFPHKKNLFIVTVNFPFIGSSQLFQYAPSNLTFSTSDTGIYQPDYDNVIAVTIQIETLDKSQVQVKAKALMNTTFSLINQNNSLVEQWSLAKESIIGNILQQKRAEILEFYN